MRDVVDRGRQADPGRTPGARRSSSRPTARPGCTGCSTARRKMPGREAADLSASVAHQAACRSRSSTVLSCAPPMYDELWVAGKCMYKLEPVVADGGELIIYAPHMHEISVTHGKLIKRGRLPLPRLLHASSGTGSSTIRGACWPIRRTSAAAARSRTASRSAACR